MLLVSPDSPDSNAGAGSNSTGKRNAAGTTVTGATATPGSPTSGRLPYRDLLNLTETLQDKLRKATAERDEFSRLASQRQDAFLKSEAQYREDIQSLKQRLQQMGIEEKDRMEPLRTLQSNIHDTIHSIQDKTARILQDQERDLIRAFRARLQDLSVELERERKKNESGAAEWVARCRKLSEELSWMRDLVDKLTSENKQVLKENRRFKRQMKTQEEDREFLIKQLVAVKKENARLRYSFDQLMAGKISSVTQMSPGGEGSPSQTPPGAILPNGGLNSSITGLPVSQSKPLLRAATPSDTRPGTSHSMGSGPRLSPPGLPSRPQSAMVHPSGGMRSGMSSAGPSRPGTAAGYPYMESQGGASGVSGGGSGPDDWSDKERRYKQLLSKMQRQIDDLSSRYRSLKTQHTSELLTRNELQEFLKKCIDDVRKNMAERMMMRNTATANAVTTQVKTNRRATSAGLARKTSTTSSHSSSSYSSLPSSSSPPPVDPRSIPLSEFTPNDRINVMEWLMSQDQVIFMLYDMLFPRHGGGAPNTNVSGLGDQHHSVAAQQRQLEAEMSRLLGGHASPSRREAMDPTSGKFFNEWSSSSSGQGLRRPDTAHQSPSSSRQQANTQRIRPSTATPARTTQSTTGTINPASPESRARDRSSAPVGSQYERPLGSRPLSGLDQASGLLPPSLLSQSAQSRPQTASTSPSQHQQQQQREVTAADIEAELQWQREQRDLHRPHHEDDEDDGEGEDSMDHRLDDSLDRSAGDDEAEQKEG